jgi:hypothetical protein
LCGTGDEITTGFLLLYGTKQAKQIHEHDAVSKFRLIVQTVDLAPVLRNGGKRKDIVQVEVERRVDVINQGIDVLFRSLVERDDGECGTSAAMCLEDALVVFNCLTTVTRRGDNDVGTTRKETFEDLNANRAFSNAGEKGILVLESCSRCCGLAEEVKIDTGEVAGILPGTSGLALEMK